MANRFSIENVTFTPSELMALYFLKELLISYSSLDIGVISTKLISKIITNLPKPDRAYIEVIGELLKINAPNTISEKDIAIEIIDTIKKSIEMNRKLCIVYHSFNKDEITERIFDPYLIEIYEGCYHLIGHCHYRKGIRDLRIGRIKKAKLLNKTFKRPENFYDNYKKGRFGKLAGEEKIKLILKFSGEAARYIKEYESAKADTLADKEDGSLIFYKTTTLTPEVIKWILGFGGSIEVIKPEVVKNMIIEQTREMAEKYEV